MNWRKYHRIISIIFVLPLALIAMSGVVLQLRNQFEGIQPKSIQSPIKTDLPFLTYEKIIETHGLKNIDQIIFKPGKNNLALRMKDGMEIQIDSQTGEVLKKAPRLTGVLIDFHQGTWLGSIGQYGVYLPTSLALCFLIVSGIIIYPFKRRRKS